MRAITMKRHLESNGWWKVDSKGWPLYICFDDRRIVMVLMKDDKKMIAKALKGNLRCYQRIVNNDYRLLKAPRLRDE